MERLYKWQGDAIQFLSRNKEKNILLTAPTGAGKTLINYAFLGIFNPQTLKFQNPSERVIYTTPIKSLANDKYFELSNLGLDVGVLTGDITINPEAKILICTQEVYQEAFKGKGYKVVIDEFHYAFQSPERALAFVDLSPTDRYLFSSATIKVDEDLLNYLKKITGRDVAYYSTDFRPTELIFHKEKVVPRWDSEWEENSVAIDDVFQKGKTVLVVAFTRRNLEELQYFLSRYFDEYSTDKLTSIEVQKIEQIAEELGLQENKLKEYFPFYDKGIFIYHGKLPYTAKVFVENVVRNKLARAILSTDAISLGVNFPISDIVFSQLTKFDGKEWRELYPSEFRQIAGRAGRKGFYEVGHIWVGGSELDVDRYNDTEEIYNYLVDAPLENPKIEINLSLLDLLKIYEKKEINQKLNTYLAILKEITQNEESAKKYLAGFYDAYQDYSGLRNILLIAIDNHFHEIWTDEEKSEIKFLTEENRYFWNLLKDLYSDLTKEIYERLKFNFPNSLTLSDIRHSYSNPITLLFSYPLLIDELKTEKIYETFKTLLKVKEINPTVVEGGEVYTTEKIEVLASLAGWIKNNNLSYEALVNSLENLTNFNLEQDKAKLALLGLKVLRKTNSIDKNGEIVKRLLNDIKDEDYILYRMLLRDEKIKKFVKPIKVKAKNNPPVRKFKL